MESLYSSQFFAYELDQLDPFDFGFLDPDQDPQKYAATWILIKGVNIN